MYELIERCAIKNILVLAVLKLGVKDSFEYNKEIENMWKTFPTIQAFYI